MCIRRRISLEWWKNWGNVACTIKNLNICRHLCARLWWFLILAKDAWAQQRVVFPCFRCLPLHFWDGNLGCDIRGIQEQRACGRRVFMPGSIGRPTVNEQFFFAAYSDSLKSEKSEVHDNHHAGSMHQWRPMFCDINASQRIIKPPGLF